MKVICIDASKRYYSDDTGKDVKEGNVYEVTDSWTGRYSGAPYYSLAGFDCVRGLEGFRQDRFIPLSNIDEMEVLENERQLVSAN